MDCKIEAVVDHETIEVTLVPKNSSEKALLLAVYDNRHETSIDDDGSVTIHFYNKGARR